MLLSHNHAVASPFQAATATANDATSGTGSTGSTSSDSSTSTATITANDFLQLLVTELQNQDPTANTDPNEYVDQLVQVNSLQQLISINQDLAPLSTDTSTSDVAQQSGAAKAGPLADTSSTGAAHASASHPHPASLHSTSPHSAATTGNLSANVDTHSTMAASATRVASSLRPRQERTTSPATPAIVAGMFTAH